MPKTVTLGTKLIVVDGAYDTPVGNLTKIGVPGPTKAEIDVTDFDSVAVETLAGLPDNGELSFEGFLNMDDEGQDLLLTDALDPEAPTRNFRIEFTRQSKKFEFAGWVKAFVPSADSPNDAYTFTGSIRIDGAVTPGDLY